MANNIDIKVSDNQVKVPISVSTKGTSRSVGSEQHDPFYVGAEAKVEQLEDGALVTCKDKSGTTTARIYDGTDGQDGQDGVDGQDGADGFSPIIEIESITDGHRITITDAEQTQSVDVMDGEDGTDGQDGYTPIKGVDYFDGADGKDGQDGYTPQKGIDYFDGEDGKDGQDGYTPQKGIDYFDGEKGDTGDTGNGIASTVLNADYTLTITFTDGTSVTTSSIRGEQGIRGETGATGATGNGIASVVKTGTEGLVDTYTITFTDGTTTTFTVTNGQNGSGSVADVWVDGVSVLDGDTAKIDLSGKADVSSLADVATSGAYSDLTGKPTLSAVATSGSYSDLSNKPSIPTKTSELNNDSGYITGYTETDPIFTASAAHGISASDIANWNGKSDFSGDYDDLTDKPQINSVMLSGNKTLADLGLLDFCHPVGKVIQTVNKNYNPNTSLGGTWTLLPEGTVILSGSTSGTYKVGTDTSTGSGYKEYGENTHALTVNEMPSHKHQSSSVLVNASGAGSRTSVAGGNTYGFAYNNAFDTTNTGGGQAHNIMQKSIAMYIWIRTA